MPQFPFKPSSDGDIKTSTARAFHGLTTLTEKENLRTSSPACWLTSDMGRGSKFKEVRQFPATIQSLHHAECLQITTHLPITQTEQIKIH
ncbi:unnamed protein product [Schistocephalus solidus]|uniref:Uncharacterized protein n=1 Tax=Schistocephalus solidus TaxID=70667 RepID=A0A183SAA6_SCHSO|nr:unnamed protein product [Schistocephalus solidus]